MKITEDITEQNFLTYINVAPEDAVPGFRQQVCFSVVGSGGYL